MYITRTNENEGIFSPIGTTTKQYGLLREFFIIFRLQLSSLLNGFRLLDTSKPIKTIEEVYLVGHKDDLFVDEIISYKCLIVRCTDGKGAKIPLTSKVKVIRSDKISPRVITKMFGGGYLILPLNIELNL